MRCTAAFALAGLLWSVPNVHAAPPPLSAPPLADAPAPADLTLGGEIILRLRADAGGLTPQQRVDTIQGRIAAILGTPNIKPADVTVYAPAKGTPVIYALGRRLLTVDAATVRAAGSANLTPLEAASEWAKRLQQVLPRVCWRPSNAPDTIVPAHPPLLVTPDLARVGGNSGFVILRGKPILTLHGPQHGGLTAQERADILTARLERLADLPARDGAVAGTDTAQAGVTVRPDGPASVTLLVAGQPFFSADMVEAKVAGVTPVKLAGLWAGRIRAALHLPDPNALPAAVSAPAPSSSALPTAVLPAPPVPAADTPPAPGAPTPVVPPAAP